MRFRANGHRCLMAALLAAVVLLASTGASVSQSTPPNLIALRTAKTQIDAMNASIQQETAKISQLSGSARELELIKLKDMMERRAAMIQTFKQLQTQSGGNSNCALIAKC